MQVVVSNNITITNASPELINWCQKSLKLDNPEYAKKARMGFWLGNTPKHLYLYEVHGDKLVLPYGCLKSIVPYIEKEEVSSAFNRPEKVEYGEPIPLYPYQEKAVTECQNNIYGILQSPCGSGKTRCGLALIKRLERRALWLTHTADLLNQSKRAAEEFYDKDFLGTITEGKVNLGKGITFATVQTMCKLDLSLLKNYWDVIVVDECHRCVTSPTQVTMFGKVLNSLSARHKYGLSATVHRADGLIKATFALLGDVIYTVPESDIADRTMKVGIKPVSTGISLSIGCLNTDGTLNYTKLINYLCKDEDRTKFIADCIFKECKHSCLILSDRLEHLSNIIDALPLPLQEYAVMISGKMTTKKGKAERAQAIEDMKTGKKHYLFATYNLCKEGLDIPCLDRLFLTTPQKDFAVITQSIGRIARTHEGKADPICYDFVDNIGYLQKTFKKRCSIYKKNGCYFVGDDE